MRVPWRKPRRNVLLASGLLVALAVGAAVATTLRSDDESPVAECGEPTRLTRGSIQLGAFNLSGFDEGQSAQVSPMREVRLFATRVRPSQSPIVLRAEDCISGEHVKLIAIGAPRPTSLPSTFPIETAEDAVTLAESDWYALVSFPPSRERWRLVATSNGSVTTVVISGVARFHD
jgi:hypothetical protein